MFKVNPDEPTRGVSLALMAFAGVIKEGNPDLFEQALQASYEALDKERSMASDHDVSLGYEILELVSAFTSREQWLAAIRNLKKQ